LGDAILNFCKSYCSPKFELPTSTKSGRKYMDKIINPFSSFKKTLVLKDHGVEYYLEYRSIYNAVCELLSNEDIAKSCVFDYQVWL